MSDYEKGMMNAYGNVGDGLKAEQARKAAGYDKGMLNAYGNIGDGLKAEQARKTASYNKGMQHALGGSKKPNPADAFAYAKGTGGVSDYDKGLQHEMGVGKPTPEDAFAYARGTGGVSDYDKGMQHALGGSKKPNPADAFAYARGTGGVSDYDTGMAHAMGNVGDGSKAEQVRKALEGYSEGMLNAYGNIGDGLKAAQEREASYNTGMQHALGGSGKGNNPSAALGAKEQQINQKLDEIVNGQNLSETAQGKLNEDLQKLNAEKNVITWQQQNPNATEEDFDSKNEFFEEQINRAADEYLNEFGGRDDAETKEAFAEYSEQVHGIVAQRDAYNRAAMGVDTSVKQKG